MPYWDTGQSTLVGARLKMEADQQKLRALAGAVKGGRQVISDYRSGGVMGVLDPAGEKERRDAEIEQAELEARLGAQQEETEASTEIPGGPDEYELSGHPGDWLNTLADVGGAAAGAVFRGPGGGHQRSLVELARFRGRLKEKEDELARARSLSSTISGSADPGAVLERVAPSLGFEKGDIPMRAGSKDDPRSDWAMAWAAAREKAAKEGREPTTDEVRDAHLEMRMDRERLDQHLNPEKAQKKSSLEQQLQEGREILREKTGKEPTREEVWNFVRTRPESALDRERRLEIETFRKRFGTAGEEGDEGGEAEAEPTPMRGGTAEVGETDDDDLDVPSDDEDVGDDGLTAEDRKLFYGRP